MSARELLARVATLGGEVRAEHQAAVVRAWHEGDANDEGEALSLLGIGCTGCTCGDLTLYPDTGGGLWAASDTWAIDISDRLREALDAGEVAR